MRNILLPILLLKTIMLSGQSPTDPYTGAARNSLLAVFGGSGIYTSLIYERSLIQTGNFQFGAKGGVGISPFRLTFPHEFNIPVGVFMLFGQKNHHPDLSLNVTNLLIRQYDPGAEDSHKEHKAVFVPTLAYRYQKLDGGVTLKIGLSPIIYFNSIQTTVSPWLELSVGWSF